MKLRFDLNLEWYEDTEFVFNVLESEDDYDSWNDETVWKTAYEDYQIYTFPIRKNKKIVGYGFNIIPFHDRNELNAYNSFVNEETVTLYKNHDHARSYAETYLKENLN